MRDTEEAGKVSHERQTEQGKGQRLSPRGSDWEHRTAAHRSGKTRHFSKGMRRNSYDLTFTECEIPTVHSGRKGQQAVRPWNWRNVEGDRREVIPASAPRSWAYVHREQM